MESRSDYAEVLLADLLTRYQIGGIVVYGQIDGFPGTYAKLLVKSDGTLKVEGTSVVSGSVAVSNFPSDYFKAGQNIGNTGFNVNNFPSDYDVQDRANRLLGLVYGSQNQQLKQRAATYELLVQLANAGSEIDPRSIRALAKATDEIYSVLRTDAGAAYDARDRSWTITENLNRAWALAKATDNVYSVLKTDAGAAYDARDRSWTITEALARSWTLGSSDIVTAYGSQTQALLQRASTYDLLVQMRNAGSEIDPRSIRALVKSTDEVYSVLRTDAGVAYDARSIRALVSSDIITAYGSLGALQQRATSLDLYAALRQGGSELSTSNPIFAGIVDASGNRMPSMDTSARPGYMDMIDRSGRLVGVVYGSQSQALLQRASTYDLLVALRYQGSEIDPRSIRTLTSTDNVTVADVTKVVSTPAGSGAGYLVPIAFSAGETKTIVNGPGSGKKLRLKGIQISVDGVTRIDLQWGTTAFRSYFLGANGNIERNFIDDNYEGGDNVALTIKSTAAVNVTASASTETLNV